MDILSSKVATYVEKMGPHAVDVRLKRNPVGLARFLLDSEKENLPKLLATSKIGVYFLPIAECFIARSKCLSNKTHQDTRQNVSLHTAPFLFLHAKCW